MTNPAPTPTVRAAQAQPDPRVEVAAEAMKAKRQDLIHQPLSFIWRDLARAVLEALTAVPASSLDKAEAKAGAIVDEIALESERRDVPDPHLRQLSTPSTHTAAGAGPVGEVVARTYNVEAIAKVISLSYGEDPEEDAPLSRICGPNNEPLPCWMAYEEQARAVFVWMMAVVDAIARPVEEPGEVGITDDMVHRAGKAHSAAMSKWHMFSGAPLATMPNPIRAALEAALGKTKEGTPEQAERAFLSAFLALTEPTP